MPGPFRSTQQVADEIGVPYSRLIKWQSNDHLLKPARGGGGRRGGDLWSPNERLLARVVAHLRGAGLPLPLVRSVLRPLRALRTALSSKAEVTVYVTVCLRTSPRAAEQTVACLRIDRDGELRDPSQLALF